LLAVSSHANAHGNPKSIEDLRPRLIDEIKEFFVGYNKLRDREFRPEAIVGVRRAEKLVQVGMKAFRGKTDAVR
jgi:inorganic pyrophosphatase